MHLVFFDSTTSYSARYFFIHVYSMMMRMECTLFVIVGFVDKWNKNKNFAPVTFCFDLAEKYRLRLPYLECEFGLPAGWENKQEGFRNLEEAVSSYQPHCIWFMTGSCGLSCR